LEEAHSVGICRTPESPARQRPPGRVAIAAAPVETSATVSFDDYGAESGSVGIPECDRCVQFALESNARCNGAAIALLAETKQQRLVWKRAAGQAKSTEEREKLRAECRATLDKLVDRVDALGCPSAAGSVE